MYTILLSSVLAAPKHIVRMLADKSHVGDTSEHSEVQWGEIVNINLFEKVNVANDIVSSP